MSFSKGATVLVTGATGVVGPSVVQVLCEAGHVHTFSLDRTQGTRLTGEVGQRVRMAAFKLYALHALCV